MIDFQTSHEREPELMFDDVVECSGDESEGVSGWDIVDSDCAVEVPPGVGDAEGIGAYVVGYD